MLSGWFSRSWANCAGRGDEAGGQRLGRFLHLVVFGTGTLNAGMVTLANGDQVPVGVNTYVPVTAKTGLVPEALIDGETEKLLE